MSEIEIEKEIEYELVYKQKDEKEWIFWDSFETLDEAQQAMEKEIKRDNSDEYTKGLFVYRIVKREVICTVMG